MANRQQKASQRKNSSSHILRKLAYSIIVLTAVCACTSDMDPVEESLAGSMTLSATFEQSQTKTALGDENSIIWEAGDAISVFDAGQAPANTKFSLTGGAGTACGTFTGNGVKSDKGYFAVYPYTENLITLNSSSEHPEGVLSFRSANYSIQYARKGNIPSNIPMVAYVSAPEEGTEVALNFKNLFSYLKFKIEYRCKSVTFSSKSGNALTPSDYTVSFDSDGLPVVSVSLSAVSTVTLKNEDGSALEPGTYYMAVLPQTLSEGFTMTFTSAYDASKTYSCEDEHSVELKRSHILNFMTVNIFDIAGLEGLGTKESPYLIKDFQDLSTMSSLVYCNVDNYAKAYYKQVKDIDCEQQTLSPIGGDTYFSGTYDGFGHTISNLVEGEASFDDLLSFSLFGCIKNATICRLNIENPSFVKLSAEASYNLSPLVGVAISENGKNTISDCHILCDSLKTIKLEKIQYLDYGGIVAFNESEIEISNCSSNLNLYVDCSSQNDGDHLYLGGIVGYTSGEKTSDPTHDKAENDALTSIKYCRFSGEIKIENVHNKKTSLGGIVGMCHDSSSGDVLTEIGACVFSGDLEAWKLEPIRSESEEPFMGGIVGSMDSDGYVSGLTSYNPKITCCLVTGAFGSDSNLEDYLNLGGLAGYLYDSDTKFTYCVVDEVNKTHTSGYDGYEIPGGCPVFHTMDNLWNSGKLEPQDCYVTNEDWYFMDEDYITYKPDLTAKYMNGLTDGIVTWSDDNGIFDLVF